MTTLDFGSMPRRAQLLLVLMGLLGIAALISGVAAPPRGHVVAYVAYLLLAFLSSSRRLRMHPRGSTMSLGFLFVFAALLECGRSAAVAAAALSAFGVLIFAGVQGRRQNAVVMLYAAGTLASSAWVAGTLFQHFAPAAWTFRQLDHLLLPYGAAVTAYFLLSISGMVLMSTVTGRGGVRNLPAEVGWMGPVYYAGAAAALLLNEAYRYIGLAVFLLGLPLFYAVQRAFALRAEQLRHSEERAEAGERMARLYLAIVEALAAAIDAKDHGTRLHVRRVQALAGAVARRVGLSGDELQAVETGAVLHDIGKLAIPDQILGKPSRLTPSEYRTVRTHAEVGEAILRPIDFGVDVGSLVRHHHEKMDGSGYPDGLSGEAIPMGARVLGVIDVYDALVSTRPYRQAWKPEQAIAHLRQHAGTSFDPAVVEALADALESGELPHAEETPEAAQPLPATTAPVGWMAPPSGDSEGDMAEATAQQLRETVEALIDDPGVHTCVASVVDERFGEMDVVAACGEWASTFRGVRTPLRAGASGAVAATGRLAVCRGAEDDLSYQTAPVPPALADSTVHAFPVVDTGGRLVAVLSLYSYAHTDIPASTLARAAAAAAECGCRVGALALGPAGVHGDGGLLEYAGFLVALARDLERAKAIGERRAVMCLEPVGIQGAARRLALGQLAHTASVAARGDARVLERESAGEVLVACPTVVEAAVRRAAERFVVQGAELASWRGTSPWVAVGSAVFPEDADQAPGLLCVAEVRLAASQRDLGPLPRLEESAVDV